MMILGFLLTFLCRPFLVPILTPWPWLKGFSTGNPEEVSPVLPQAMPITGPQTLRGQQLDF